MLGHYTGVPASTVSLCKTNRFQKSRHCDAISSFTRHRAPCATPSRHRRRHALWRKTKTRPLALFLVEELASQCRRSVPLRRDGHDDQAINAADNDGRQHSLPAPNGVTQPKSFCPPGCRKAVIVSSKPSSSLPSYERLVTRSGSYPAQAI